MSFASTLRLYFKRTPKKAAPTDIYAHKVTLLDGAELDLETLRGRPTLIVNTASKCGFTPQYEGLQSLYETYKGQGLQILGTPSPDFANQEYDTAEEVGAFCKKNFGVSFPLTQPLSVRADPDPLWQDINSQPNSGPPKWNFSKYLIDGNGTLIQHWGSTTKPEDPKLVSAIESALGA